MSSYIGLGSRSATGILDQTGNNPGNWTITFDTAAININVPRFECHHMVVTGAAGSTFKVYQNVNLWSVSNNGYLNEWDPMQPLLLQPSDTVYFYYSDPTSDGIPPVARVWFRYDADLAVNKQASAGLS